jgi:hypothetical protein
MTAPIRQPLADAEPMRGRGHRLPETQARYAERNQLIAEMVVLFTRGASANDAAFRTHRALDIYANGGWRHERDAVSCPAHHIGRVNGHCWMILHLVDRVPGREMVRKIIARAAIHYQGDALRCDSSTSQRRGDDNGWFSDDLKF